LLVVGEAILISLLLIQAKKWVQLNDQAIALFNNYKNVRTRTKGSKSYLIEQALIMNLNTGFH
jgi:hypothetical protein